MDDTNYCLYEDNNKFDKSQYLTMLLDYMIYNQDLVFDHSKHIYTVPTNFIIDPSTLGVNVVSDCYLRFKFLKRPTDQDLSYALKIISQIFIDYKIGGATIFKIPLRINIIISKLVGKEIKLFDTNEFLNNVTNEEHKKLCYKLGNEYCTGTCKYYFDDKNGYYLDIPLLDDFYLSKNGGNINATKCHPRSIQLCVAESIKNQLSQLFSNEIYYGFERIEFQTGEFVKSVNKYATEYAILIPHSYNFITNSLDCDLEINFKSSCMCKFIFISLSFLNDEDNILPSILEINITCDNDDIINIPIDHCELYEFNGNMVYGMCIDTNYCMKDWLNCQNEYNDLRTMHDNILSVDSVYGFNWLNNYNDTDKIKAIKIYSIQLILSDHCENVVIDTTVMGQNILRNAGGMAGVGYA